LLLAFASSGCHVLDFSPRFAEGEIDIFDDLFAVSVIDDQRVVAVGYHGAAYWTEDGGENWGKGKTNTSRLLYAVSMANARVGWAVGQLGTIIRTEDGGRTWTQQTNSKQEEGSHLFGVHAIDEQRAWVVGVWGTRIFTEDGGATWADRSVPVTLDHPMFVWLSSDDQARVRGGELVYEDVGLNNVFCLPQPATNCWIVGEFGYIFHSEDLGVTWTRGEILGAQRMDPIQLPYNQIEITDDHKSSLIEFAASIEDATHLNVLIEPYANDRELAEFGNEEDPSELFDILSARIDEVRSVLEDNGILSDRMRMPNKPPWDFEDFVEHDESFLTRYFDGRRADEPGIKVAVMQNPYLFTIRFTDPTHGLIAGLGGVILQTEDGGASWYYRDTDRKQAIFSVDIGESRAVAVGEKGLIRVSTDGGSSWSEPSESEFPTIFTFMRDLAFDRTRKVGFIVGQEGMVLRTTDSGKNWSQVLPGEDRRKS
jgi:photosystem II stability/assembly factor-like uncharacterized protein